MHHNLFMPEAQSVENLLSANRGKDRYQAPDFYAIDDLLTEEQKLVRQSVRDWVKKDQKILFLKLQKVY